MNLCVIPSGPHALLGYKFRSSFFTPSSVMLMFLQSTYSGRSGFGGQRSWNSSAVTVSLGLNTEQNGLLRSWACSLRFVMSFPVSLSGETPIPTVLLALMKLRNFFLEGVGFYYSNECSTIWRVLKFRVVTECLYSGWCNWLLKVICWFDQHSYRKSSCLLYPTTDGTFNCTNVHYNVFALIMFKILFI